MNKPYLQQWRDENEEIEYPFLDESNPVDLTGTLEIPTTWLVDAAVYVPEAEPPIYISSIRVDGSKAYITLSDSNFVDLGVGEADRFSQRPIAVKDENGVAIATLVPGRFANEPLFVAGDGEYQFSPGGLVFVSSVVLIGSAPGVSGFSVGNEKTTRSPLVIVAENGVQISHSRASELTASGRSRQVDLLTINVFGDSQAEHAMCDDDSRVTDRFVQEIVFQYGNKTVIVGPDEVGNVVLSAQSPSVNGSALKIQNKDGEISFRLSGRSAVGGS
ncbi:MAG: hypothetical protein D6800_09010 [Candidatus Zixiibacteriota bacterium]|nr:MAG: hypothetical protein D6800_09010 [candidate division Zixibacteria bacterium]